MASERHAAQQGKTSPFPYDRILAGELDLLLDGRLWLSDEMPNQWPVDPFPPPSAWRRFRDWLSDRKVRAALLKRADLPETWPKNGWIDSFDEYVAYFRKSNSSILDRCAFILCSHRLGLDYMAIQALQNELNEYLLIDRDEWEYLVPGIGFPAAH